MRLTKARLAAVIFGAAGALLLERPVAAAPGETMTAAIHEAPDVAASPSPAPRSKETVEGDGPPAQSASSATRIAAPLEALPVSISVVSPALMQSQAARTLPDALRNVPGVHPTTGFGVFDYFTIRGFDSLSSSLILTDGAAEPQPAAYSLYNVERVEVLRGPGSYLYGGHPLSGTVNLVRKQPSAGRFADVRVSAGSFATVDTQLDANYAPAAGRSAYRLNALYGRADNYRDDKGSHVFAVNPTATWQLGERTPLSVSLEYVDNFFKPDVGLPIVGGVVPEVPRTRSYQSPFDRSQQGLLRARVDFETRLGSKGTLRDKLYFTAADLDTDATLLNGAFPGFAGDFAIARSIVLLHDHQRLFGNQLEASWSFGTGYARHVLLAGFEASSLTDDYTSDTALLPATPLFENAAAATPPFASIPGKRLAADSRALVFAPYVSDRIAFGDRLVLLAAGRFDALDYRDQETLEHRREGQWSPMFGLRLSPWRRLSLYANFAKAFAPPPSLVVGERQPERTTQYEAGTKTRLLGGRALLTAAVFQIEKKNVAIPDASGVTRQQGRQRSRGLELELQAELRPGWNVFAAYALTDAKLTEFRELVTLAAGTRFFGIADRSGNRLPFAPRNLFNVWTERASKGGFAVAAGGRYTCTQFIAADNAFKIHDHWVFDAGLRYKTRGATLRLNLQNLASQKYETRGFGHTAVVPANPFALSLAVQLSLGKRP